MNIIAIAIAIVTGEERKEKQWFVCQNGSINQSINQSTINQSFKPFCKSDHALTYNSRTNWLFCSSSCCWPPLRTQSYHLPSETYWRMMMLLVLVVVVDSLSSISRWCWLERMTRMMQMWWSLLGWVDDGDSLLMCHMVIWWWWNNSGVNGGGDGVVMIMVIW